LSKTDGLFALVIGAESWWREGEESSVGGLDGGLWWFSDGDETEESSRTHNDGQAVGDGQNTHKKPVARLEGVAPPLPHLDHSEPLMSAQTGR